MGPTRVLVVEDDATVSDVVVRYLEREGYEVESVPDGAAALDRAIAEPPDLVLLDVMLPGLDGLEVCRRLRAVSAVPIIMLTARGEETDRITGLDRGADDYVTKPFSPRELTARVRSVLRRSRTPAAVDLSGPLVAGDLVVDVRAHSVQRGGVPVALTAREFELLAFFMRHPGEVFRREQLLEHVWGYTYGDTSTVTVHVRRLRDKIEDHPSHPQLVQTVWGLGYRFDQPNQPDRIQAGTAAKLMTR